MHSAVLDHVPIFKSPAAGREGPGAGLSGEQGSAQVAIVARHADVGGCCLLQVQQFENPALTNAFTISSTTVSTAFCEYVSRPGCNNMSTYCCMRPELMLTLPCRCHLLATACVGERLSFSSPREMPWRPCSAWRPSVQQWPAALLGGGGAALPPPVDADGALHLLRQCHKRFGIRPPAFPGEQLHLLCRCRHHLQASSGRMVVCRYHTSRSSLAWWGTATLNSR